MKSTALRDLLSFTLYDNYVECHGSYFHLYRYYPPNIDIMTATEIAREIDNLSELLNTMEQPFAMFATDKVENLSQIRNFYASLDPRFDAYTSEIIAHIDTTEEKSASVQRAFYFIVASKTTEDEAYNRFAGKGYRISNVDREELATLLRNYYVREFVSSEIHTLEATILQDKKTAARIAKRPDLLPRELERRLLPHRIDFHVHYAMVNGLRRKTLMVKNLPREIQPCALMAAATMRGTSFMMRFTPMLSSEVKRMTDNQFKNKSILFGSRQATDVIEASGESNALMDFYKSISSNKTQVYYTSIFIEVYGETDDALDQNTEKLLGNLPAGVTIDKLQREQKDGFLSVNPLGKDLYREEANNLPSLSAAALYPFSYSSRLDAHGMLLGSTLRGGSFFLDLLQRGAGLTNSNFTIIGDSGQGKSTLLKKIIEYLTMFGVCCFTLDPENEYGHMFKQLGGTVYKCVDGRSIINPLEVRWLFRDDEEPDKDDQLLKELQNMSMFFQHLSWLKDFFEVLFPGIEYLDLQALMILTQEMYESRGITAATPFQQLEASDYPILGDLYEFIEKYNCQSSRIIKADTVSRLLLLLRQCYDGPLSQIFNGHTSLTNGNMICFEAAELLEGSKDRTQAVLFNIATWIWTQVMRRDRRIAFNLDELYLFMENLIMVKYISSFVKRVRKYNGLIGVSTQQLADCLRPDISTYTTALFNNSAYKFMFHPGLIDMDLVQEKLKLTPGEIQSIRHPNQGHCLVKAGSDRYYVHVEKFGYEDDLFGQGGGQ